MRSDNKPITPAATAIVAAGLVATTVIASPAGAAKVPVRMDLSAGPASAPAQTVTLAEEAVLSSAAGKALRQIARARGDIEHSDRNSLERHIRNAKALLDIAEAALPATVVRDRIWVAKKHLEYENAQEVLSELAPIYGSLDNLADYMQVQDARRHLDRAKESLGRKDKDKATAEFDAANAALDDTEVDLPLRAARRLFARAEDEIRRANPAAAQDALKAAEDNVVFLTVATHEPLAEAHRSLWRAMQDYAAGAYDAARSDVHRAAGYLDYEISASDANTRKAAQALLDKARALQGKIAAKSSEVPALLSDLRDRTKALSERSVEYFTTAWERLDNGGQLKTDLIEAKLHLAYAEIDRDLAKDTRQAKDELAQAEDYLAKAVAQARQDQITEVESLRDRVKAMTSTQALNQTKDQYADLKARLTTLIETL